MLYLDTSVLIKRYVKEAGSDAVRERFIRARDMGERIFTSALSYAEIMTVLGRKIRGRELTPQDYQNHADRFLADWGFSLSILEVDTSIMSSLPNLVTRFPLKAADAVHLSAVIWLRDTSRLVPEFAAGDAVLEFGVADQSLARIAAQCGLTVFNPEHARL